jgi:hypothetical protein
MKQSILPEAYEQKNIRKMDEGEIGYTVPWAMYATSDRLLWINGNYSVHQTPYGTYHLRIKRVRNGVIVDEKTIGDHSLSIGGASFVGGCDEMPVALTSDPGAFNSEPSPFAEFTNDLF